MSVKQQESHLLHEVKKTYIKQDRESSGSFGHPSSLLSQCGRCPKTSWCTLVCGVDLVVSTLHQCNALSNEGKLWEQEPQLPQSRPHSDQLLLREACYHEKRYLWALPLRSLLSVSIEDQIFISSLAQDFQSSIKSI